MSVFISKNDERDHMYNNILFIFMLFICIFRRVHITKATLLELGDKFDVEDGKGQERDEVLAKLGIDTYLIIPPKQHVRILKTRKLLAIVVFGSSGFHDFFEKFVLSRFHRRYFCRFISNSIQLTLTSENAR